MHLNTNTGTNCTLLKHTDQHTKHTQTGVAVVSQPVLLVSSVYRDGLCVCVCVCVKVCVHMFPSTPGLPTYICMSLFIFNILIFVCVPVLSPPLMFSSWRARLRED